MLTQNKTEKNTGYLNSMIVQSHWLRKCASVLGRHTKHLHTFSFLVIVNFILMGLAFFTNVKIANVLGRNGFGLVAYGLAWGAYAAVFVSFGFDRTMVRQLNHFPQKNDVLINASLIIRATLMLIVILITSLSFVLSASSSFSWGVLLIIWASALLSLDLAAVYDDRQQTKRHATFNLIQRCLYLSIIWTTVLLMPDKLSINLIGAAMFAAALLYLAGQFLMVAPKIETNVWQMQVWMTAWLLVRQNCIVWVATMSALFFGAFNQLVLEHYGGSLELGGYAAAFQFVIAATVMLMQVVRVAKRSMANKTSEPMDMQLHIKFLWKYSLTAISVVMPISLCAILIPSMILQLLFRPEFASAAPVLRILGFYVLVLAIGVVTADYLIAVRKELWYMSAVVVGAAVSIVLCYTLVPQYGALGAACSLLVGHGIAILFYSIYVFYYIKTNLSQPKSENQYA